jgi:hypothetical protein
LFIKTTHDEAIQSIKSWISHEQVSVTSPHVDLTIIPNVILGKLTQFNYTNKLLSRIVVKYDFNHSNVSWNQGQKYKHLLIVWQRHHLHVVIKDLELGDVGYNFHLVGTYNLQATSYATPNYYQISSRFDLATTILVIKLHALKLFLMYLEVQLRYGELHHFKPVVWTWNKNSY